LTDSVRFVFSVEKLTELLDFAVLKIIVSWSFKPLPNYQIVWSRLWKRDWISGGIGYQVLIRRTITKIRSRTLFIFNSGRYWMPQGTRPSFFFFTTTTNIGVTLLVSLTLRATLNPLPLFLTWLVLVFQTLSFWDWLVGPCLFQLVPGSHLFLLPGPGPFGPLLGGEIAFLGIGSALQPPGKLNSVFQAPRIQEPVSKVPLEKAGFGGPYWFGPGIVREMVSFSNRVPLIYFIKPPGGGVLGEGWDTESAAWGNREPGLATAKGAAGRGPYIGPTGFRGTNERAQCGGSQDTPLRGGAPRV